MLASADTNLPFLSQLLGSNSFESILSVPTAFKGMQCAVASTSTADVEAALQLQVHDLDILRGGSCKCGHRHGIYGGLVTYQIRRRCCLSIHVFPGTTLPP